jgi:hypothetical protein
MTYLGGRVFACDGRTYQQRCAATWTAPELAWLQAAIDEARWGTPAPEWLATAAQEAGEPWRGDMLAWTFTVDTAAGGRASAFCPRHRILWGEVGPLDPHPAQLPLATAHRAACEAFRDMVNAHRVALGLPAEAIGVPRRAVMSRARVEELQAN